MRDTGSSGTPGEECRDGVVTVCKRLQSGQTWEYFYTRFGIFSERDAFVQVQLLDLKQK